MPRLAKLALRCTVTGIALYLLLRAVPVQRLGEAFASADLRFIVCGVALQLAGRLANVLRLQRFSAALQLGLSARRIAAVSMASSFYGLVLPGSVAGGAATWATYVRKGAGGSSALTLMVMNRCAELATVLVAGLAYWIAAARDIRGAPLALLLATGAALLWLGLRALAGWAPKLGGFLVRIARSRAMRWLPLRQRLAPLSGELRTDVAPGAPAVAAIWLLSLLHEALLVAGTWCLARSVGLDLGPLTVAWLRILSHLALMLPISFAGLGVREGLLVLLATPLQQPGPAVLAWALLMSTGTLVAALLGGLLEARALWGKRATVGTARSVDESPPP